MTPKPGGAQPKGWGMSWYEAQSASCWAWLCAAPIRHFISSFAVCPLTGPPRL